MTEVWKDIPGYEGLYQVSDQGNVRSLARIRQDGRLYMERNLKCSEKQRYYQVSLFNNGVMKKHSVHRLVAEAFILNPGNKPVVNHIDGNTHNNVISNLEWCTQKENCNHGARNRKLRATAKRKRLLEGECSGVCYDKTRHLFVAYINIKGKTVAVGKFDTRPEAIAARLGAEKLLNYLERVGCNECHGISD